MFSFSPSIGLAALHPLTERRRKRVGRNTSETGECVRVIRDMSSQERSSDTLEGLSAATLTVAGVKERQSRELIKRYIPVERKKYKKTDKTRVKQLKRRGEKDEKKR